MAINSIAQNSKIKLELNGGVDGDGKQIIKSKTYSKVKTDAIDDDVYGVTSGLSSLQEMPVLAIKRINEVELQEV